MGVICVPGGWRYSYQFDIVSETPYSCGTVGHELWQARQSNLDYPDFSIIRTFSLVPIL